MKNLKLITVLLLLASMILSVTACTLSEESESESMLEASNEVSDIESANSLPENDTLNVGALAEEIVDVDNAELTDNQIILDFENGKHYLFEKERDGRVLVFITINTLGRNEFEAIYSEKFGYGFNNQDISREQFVAQKEEVIKDYRREKCNEFVNSAIDINNIYIREEYLFNYGINENSFAIGHFFVFPAYVTNEELNKYKSLDIVNTIIVWDKCLSKSPITYTWKYQQYLPL